MDRVILHVDCNKFYASVECLYNPSIRDKPVAVCGSEELRHGIVLTKNEIAAKYGIKTAEPIWQAKQKCPQLIVVPPNYPLYAEFSKLANEIYYDFTDMIEPFGLDESWLDVTNSQSIFGDGVEIANKIRNRVKDELGITVSIGVSFNKIFAKLGSDYKKPDAVTYFSRENYKDIVWPLSVMDMLLVGKSTQKKLSYYGIKTIGDLAQSDEKFIKKILGKSGETIRSFARGEDTSVVKMYDQQAAVKSIGNSTTTPRDMISADDAKLVLSVLCDSVARRMRQQGIKCDTVTIGLRDSNLVSFTRRHKLGDCTNLSCELLDAAMALLNENYDFSLSLRSIGVTASGFESENSSCQLDMMGNQEKRIKKETLERTVDSLKSRFGYNCIKSAALMVDNELTSFNPTESKTAHFYSYFN